MMAHVVFLNKHLIRCINYRKIDRSVTLLVHVVSILNYLKCNIVIIIEKLFYARNTHNDAMRF